MRTIFAKLQSRPLVTGEFGEIGAELLDLVAGADHAQAVEIACEQFRYSTLQVRYALMTLVSSAPSPGHLRAFWRLAVEALSAPEPCVREAALRCFESWELTAAIPILRRYLDTENDDFLRRMAEVVISDLEVFGDEE